MKRAELKKLIEEYRLLKSQKSDKIYSHKNQERLKEIEHRYFHETGHTLQSDLKSA